MCLANNTSRIFAEMENSPEPPPRRTSLSPKKIKIKTLKPPKQPRAQTSGMSVPDFKACQSVLSKVSGSNISLLFRNPVGE
jgi:hypothetical protein